MNTAQHLASKGNLKRLVRRRRAIGSSVFVLVAIMNLQWRWTGWDLAVSMGIAGAFMGLLWQSASDAQRYAEQKRYEVLRQAVRVVDDGPFDWAKEKSL
jgi:hypothetical protein